jgi:hypothetical protein
MKNLITCTLLLFTSSCATKYILTKSQFSDKLYCDRLGHTSSTRVEPNKTYKDWESCTKSPKYKKQNSYVIVAWKNFSLVTCIKKINTNNSDYKILSNEQFQTKTDCKLSKRFVKEQSNLRKKYTQNRRKKREQAEKDRIEKLNHYIVKNPQFIKFKNTVIEKKIELGMPERLLILSWGVPEKINKTVGSWGEHKQFVYNNRTYVYIKNGKISSWQSP